MVSKNCQSFKARIVKGYMMENLRAASDNHLKWMEESIETVYCQHCFRPIKRMIGDGGKHDCPWCHEYTLPLTEPPKGNG